MFISCSAPRARGLFSVDLMPRAMLIRNAVGFIAPSSRSPKKCSVSPVIGVALSGPDAGNRWG